MREESDLEADKTSRGTPVLCTVGDPDAHAVSRGSSHSPHPAKMGQETGRVCCIGLPWEQNADFPQLLFYLLDVVIHLMLRRGRQGVGGGMRESRGNAPGACIHPNHSRKLGRHEWEWPSQGWCRGGEGLSLVPPARSLVLGLYAGQGRAVGEGGPRPGP